MSETHSRWLCTTLVLIALLPLWIGRYPPLFDYPSHLLAAQVAVRYDDPNAGYAEGYQINARWYLRSNALATLLIIGLTQLLPIELAGRLLLSLCLGVFISGLWRLLRRAGTAWPLLLLGPPLAWHVGFSSGWINFSLGVALGLHLLTSFGSWSDNPRRWHTLILIGLLSALIAVAHVVAWALWAIVILVMAAFAGLAPPRALALLLAMALPLVPTLAAAPTLALALVLIATLAWFVAFLLRRAGLSPAVLCLAAPPIAIGCYAALSLLQPWLVRFDPALAYVRFARLSFLLRTFTITQQADPPDLLLHTVNIGLISLLALLALVLVSGAVRRLGPREPWLAALAALLVIYGLAPSGISDLQIIEPRVLIVAALLGLTFLGMPQALALRRLAVGLAGALCALWLAGACYATIDYNRRALVWQADLGLLGSARRVLSFRAVNSPPDRAGWLISTVSSRYDGSFFSSYHFIERGGYTTRIFGNGPIWLRDTVPGWIFYRPQPTDAPGHLAEQCRLARTSFDAVLLWGASDPELATLLSACLGEPVQRDDFLMWRVNGV